MATASPELQNEGSCSSVNNESRMSRLRKCLGKIWLVDWALFSALIALGILILYVIFYESDKLIQLLVPSLTIIVTILIMARSAKSTRENTNKQITAIKDSTKEQMDSAVKGFKELGTRLESIVGRLDTISISMKEAAKEASKIRELQEQKLGSLTKIQKEEPIQVMQQRPMPLATPRLIASLQIKGLLLKSYIIEMRVIQNDVFDVSVQYRSLPLLSQVFVPQCETYKSIRQGAGLSFNLGNIKSIDGARIPSFVLKIRLRDSNGQQYAADFEILKQNLGVFFDIPLKPVY